MWSKRGPLPWSKGNTATWKVNPEGKVILEQRVANHTSCVILLVILCFHRRIRRIFVVFKHPLGQFLQVDATENEDFDAESPIPWSRNQGQSCIIWMLLCRLNSLEHCINLGHIGLRKTLDHWLLDSLPGSFTMAKMLIEESPLLCWSNFLVQRGNPGTQPSCA